MSQYDIYSVSPKPNAMNTIEKLVKEYSSDKLKRIIETESAAYSCEFIDNAKDELIKRGENFEFDKQTQKDISSMSDVDLKYLVEYDWSNYHLEYVELARKEFLKRNLKNDVETEKIEEKTVGANDSKYPALHMLSIVYQVIAVLIIIGGLIGGTYLFIQDTVILGMAYILGGLIMAIMFYAISELLILLTDIEYNTRKAIE